jgi:hypothetical protein
MIRPQSHRDRMGARNEKDLVQHKWVPSHFSTNQWITIQNLEH